MDIIFQYTRKQAIEDGVLVDVTEMAKEAGISVPTAVTSTVWHDIIVPSHSDRENGQSEDGRLWDVLWMLHVAIAMGINREAGCTSSTIYYSLLVHRNGVEGKVILKAQCHPGDNLEPVITIMMPNED
ncbi:DUF6573 family protein [Brevibacillus dissolubilis]|uniref:DUF6573 family protein n=1 Tax=Brevibacillus dissolubilis TaxID=1844116 RepID=UPI001115F575|nr:DUF6573 family protein [Brevibacillus dissolubilis]